MQAHRTGKHMKQWHDADHRLIVEPGRQKSFALTKVHRHLAVRNIDAFGQTCGAASILKRGKIVRAGQWLRELG